MAGTHGNHLRHRRTTPQPPRRIGRATEFTGNNLLLGAPFMAKSVLVVDDSASVRQVVGITQQRISASASILPAVAFMLRSEEHTSELQSLMRISYAVFCLKKKNNI